MLNSFIMQFRTLDDVIKFFDERVEVESQQGDTVYDGLLHCASIAGVSRGKRLTDDSDKERLVRHLIKQGHYSVFEFSRINNRVNARHFVEFYVRQGFDADDILNIAQNELRDKSVDAYYPAVSVKAPSAIITHFLRHRSFAFLSVSFRYVKDSDLFEDGLRYLEGFGIDTAGLKMILSYKRDLDNRKIPAEFTRLLLPFATFYWVFFTPTTNNPVFSFANFFALRANTKAQFETALVAYVIYRKLTERFNPLVKMIEAEIKTNKVLSPYLSNSIFGLGEQEFLSKLQKKFEKRLIRRER